MPSTHRERHEPPPATWYRSSFLGNSATSSGGAIFVANGGSAGGPTTLNLNISHGTFENNSAGNSGGAIRSQEVMNLRNSAFRGNTSGTEGGAIYATTAVGIPLIASSSFYENTAAGSGGGINLIGTGGAIVRNVAVWGNSSDVTGAGFADLTYTCSEDFLGIGVGNQLSLTDPFVIGPAGELFLDQTSACVDNGNDFYATTDYNAIGSNWQLMTTDLLGALDASPVDMGVHY